MSKFKVVEKYETVIDAPSLEQAEQMYANDEIYITDSDFAGVDICEEGAEKTGNKIVLSEERFIELLRKEIAFDIHKAELEEKDASWITSTDRIIYGATGKNTAKDDDF